MRTLILAIPVATLAFALHLGGGTSTKPIAPFIDNSTFAVGRFDLARPGFEEAAFLPLVIADHVLGMRMEGNPDMKQINELFQSVRKLGAKEAWSIFSVAEIGFTHVFVVPLEPGMDAKAVIEKRGSQTAVQIGSAVVFGNDVACKHYAELKPVARPELAKALDAVPGMSSQFCLMLSPDARRAFEEILPTLPTELGGGPSTLLTRGVEWVAIGLEGTPKGSMHAVVKARDADTASKLHEWMAAAVKELADSPKIKESWKEFLPLANALQPIKTGDRLIIKLDDQQRTALIQPLLAKAEIEVHQRRTHTKLSHFYVAMWAYEDVNKWFPPPAIYDKQGKPLLSWRVHMLPFLAPASSEEHKLYNQFKLDEAWDSPTNKKLIAKIPVAYRHVGGKGVAEGKTPFVLPVGAATLFPGGKGLSVRDLPTGLASKALVLEAADDSMVIWTKPDDLQFDPKEPHRGLVDKTRPAFSLILADGTVHTVANSISAQTLRALITLKGPDVVGDDFYKGK